MNWSVREAGDEPFLEQNCSTLIHTHARSTSLGE
jgi:hypothetical protein